MPHTILIADDSKTIRRVVEIAFAKEPFSVVAVPDGDAAIQKAREVSPSVVLADHSMPGKSGYDVAAALKADPATANIPVLLLSGSAAPFDEGRCSQSGAVGHLQKPFDCQSLIDRVSELVGGVSDAERAAAASAPAPAAPGMAAGLPKPPGPGLGATRPTPVAPAAPVTPTQGRPLAGSGFTSTPMGTASPFGADDDSISIDLGPKTPSAPAQAARPSAPVNDPFAAPSVPQTPAPVVPAYSPAPASNAGGFGGAVASQAQASVASALAAGGVPSSDAVTAATREIIERVVWEVVPELAETLIREEIERLLRK